MIGKLLKYDIKATARYLLPLYIIFLGITIVNGFLKPFDVLEGTATFNIKVLLSLFIVIVYFLMIFAILIVTVIIQVLRFQSNLLGDEGYLSFTLPVKTWQHIISKLITSVMWIALSIIVILGSFVIITQVNIPTIIDEISIILGEMAIVFGSSIYFTFPIYLFAAMVLIILTVYNSLTIGHQFQNHKIIASFVTFYVFYFITQIIVLISLIIQILITYGNFFNVLVHLDTLPNGGHVFGIISLVLLLISIGHYFSINYFLKNRLNLE